MADLTAPNNDTRDIHGGIETQLPDRKQKESPKLPLEALTNVRDATDQAIRLEERIGELPPTRRLQAYLGITERKPLTALKPQNLRVAQIKVPPRNLGALDAFLRTQTEHVLPLGPRLIGDIQAEETTVTVMLAGKDTVHHLRHSLRKRNIGATIVSSQDPSILMRLEGHSLVASDSHLTREDENGETRTVENLDTVPSPSFDTALASSDSLEQAENERTQLPREGSCAFMMIDLSILENRELNSPIVRRLMTELSLFSHSPNFRITQYNGCLVIVETAEREGGTLINTAQRLYGALLRDCGTDDQRRTTKILLGTGEVRHHGEEQFSISGFPPTSFREELDTMHCGIYISQELDQIAADPTRRLHSLCRIETEKEEGERTFIRVNKIAPKVSLAIGGPDKLIGSERVLAKLEGELTDKETKLIIVKGAAGMGKSRITEGALSQLPAATRTAFPPAGRNLLPGYGLTIVASQIANQARESAGLSTNRDIQELQAFANLSPREQIAEAQRKPTRIVDLCNTALNQLSGPLVVDDIHHADTMSLTHIADLCAQYMKSGNKVVLLMRPEELEEPQEVENLKRFTVRESGEDAARETTIHGLDFKDPQIAREYVFHSLPAETRQGKTLGPWAEQLGRIAVNSPYIMTALIKGVLEDLVIEDEVINLTPQALARISKIGIGRKSDLDTYQRERLTGLPEDDLHLLQCVALIGGSISKEHLERIASEALSMPPNRINNSIRDLTERLYLIDQGGNFDLQHETTRQLILSTIRNQGPRLTQLYTLFRNDETLHPDSRLALAHRIATSERAPNLENPFWTEYGEVLTTSLREAESQRVPTRAHELAHQALTGKKTRIKEAIRSLTRNPSVESLPIYRTAVEALLALARNAVATSKTIEAGNAIEILERIHEKNPQLLPDLTEVHLLEFELVYINAGAEDAAKKLREIYNEKLQHANLSATQRTIVEMKLAHREGRHQGIDGIFQDGTAALDLANRTHPTQAHPDFVEAHRRISLRNYERLRGQLRRPAGRILDDDVLLSPSSLNQEQTERLSAIVSNAESLQEQTRRNPMALSPHGEFSMKDQMAQCQALQGYGKKAVRELLEVWRASTQLGIHDQAVVSAKRAGDIQVLAAISYTTKAPRQNAAGEWEAGKTEKRHTVDRTQLLAAIDTYSTPGMISLAAIENPTHFYQMAIRIQRIRAIGILCDSYSEELGGGAAMQEHLREELAPHIDQACRDIAYISTYFTDQSTNPEIQYYLAYAGQVIQTGLALRVNSAMALNSDSAKTAILNAEANKIAQREARIKHEDHGLGEIERKEKGLDLLQGILNIRDAMSGGQ